MIQWPELLVRDLARRRAVIYIGAGVSAGSVSGNGSRPPGWESFLDTGRRKLGRKAIASTIRTCIAQGDLLTACELLQDAMGDEWIDFVESVFLKPGYKPCENHRLLYSLDLPFVLTPNFDKIYDSFVQSETAGSTVVKNYYDVGIPRILRNIDPVVIKVHGTIDDPGRMVFTRSDYAAMRVNYRSFGDALSALWLTHTFFFVGTSLNDPDLRLFLEDNHFQHIDSPAHYMTVPSDEVHRHMDDSIRRNQNLKLLRYSPENEHKELSKSLAELVQLVDAARANPATIGLA